jgi:hypothetical protein
LKFIDTINSVLKVLVTEGGCTLTIVHPVFIATGSTPSTTRHLEDGWEWEGSSATTWKWEGTWCVGILDDIWRSLDISWLGNSACHPAWACVRHDGAIWVVHGSIRILIGAIPTWSRTIHSTIEPLHEIWRKIAIIIPARRVELSLQHLIKE